MMKMSTVQIVVLGEENGSGLCQYMGHLRLNLLVGVRQELDQSAVEFRRLIQHDPEEAIAVASQLLCHLCRRSPGLQVARECQQPHKHLR